MDFCSTAEMAHYTIPFHPSRQPKVHTVINAVALVPFQTIPSAQPVWFTREPLTLDHVIMGRVVAYRLDCTMVHDKVLEKPEGNKTTQEYLDDGSSIISEPIEWFWDGPDDPEYGYLPYSDDSDDDSTF